MKIVEEGVIPKDAKSITFRTTRDTWGVGPDVRITIETAVHARGPWTFVASATFPRAAHRSMQTGQIVQPSIGAPVKGARYRIIADGLD